MAVLTNNATLSVIGFVLSAYSVYVEHNAQQDDGNKIDGEYRALCDIDAIGASCRCVSLAADW
jgi:hypothetical protein